MNLDQLSLPILIGICFLPVLGFIIIQRPQFLLTLVFFCTPFQMSLLGGAGGLQGSIVDVLALLLCLPLVASLLTRPIIWHNLVTLIITFLIICLMSSAINGIDRSDITSIVRMLMITLIPLLVFLNLEISDKQVMQCVNAYLAGCSLLAIIQIFTFLTQGIDAAMSVMGLGKNFIGTIAGGAVGIVFSLFLGNTSSDHKKLIWLSTVLCLAGTSLVLSLSRGAWLATLGGCIILILLTGRVRAAMWAGIISVSVVFAVWGMLPQKATNYATDLNYKTENVQSRLDAMNKTMDNFEASPLIGSGVGLRKYIEPHNVLVLTLGETGIVGLLAFTGLFVAAFWNLYHLWKSAPETSRSVVLCAIAVFTISFFHGLFDVYWRRGIAFISWGLIGMAYIQCWRHQRLQALACNNHQKEKPIIPQKEVSNEGS